MRFGDVLRELTSECNSELRYFERKLWQEKPTIYERALIGKRTYRMPYVTNDLSMKDYEEITNYLAPQGLGCVFGDGFIEIIWGEKGDV